MKKLLIISLLLISGCGSALQQHLQAQKYVPGTEDLPVYDGFQPSDTKNLIYDSTDGRIIDASYSSQNVNIVEVKAFYAETLPQLGWRKNKSSEYRRDGESLKINVTTKNNITYLKFTIRPAV